MNAVVFLIYIIQEVCAMNTSEIISEISLFGGAFATIVSIVFYAIKYFTGKKTLVAIAIANIIIGLCMALLLLVTIIQGEALIALLGNRWNSLLIGIIFFFSISQIYLLRSSLVPALRALLRPPPSEERGELDVSVQEYLKGVLEDIQYNSLQILDMSAPLKLADMYIDMPLLGCRNAHPGDGSQESLHITDLLNTNNHYLILGEPGIGKTTLLRYMAHYVAREWEKLNHDKRKIPVYVELNIFAEDERQGGDLIKYITNIYKRRYNLSKTNSSSPKNLGDRRFLLLLDALDEIETESQQKRKNYRDVCVMIERLTRKCPDVQIIVTSRTQTYKHNNRPLKNFQRLDLRGFSPENVREFVHKWLEQSQPAMELDARKKVTDDLIFKIEWNDGLSHLASNPLLLLLILLVHKRGSELPEKRAKLYDQCVKLLWKEWDKSRGIDRSNKFEVNQKEPFLTELAWWCHKHKVKQFDVKTAQVQDSIQHILQSDEQQDPASVSEAMLNEIVAAHGLLRQNESKYQFSYTIFQEYFVAQYAVKHKKFDGLLKYRYAPWWEEVIYLYAAYTDNLPQLLQELLKDEHNDIFFTNLVMAGNCLAAKPNEEQKFLQDVIDPLFATLGATPSKIVTDQVAETLVKLDGEYIKKKLLNTLSENARKSLRDSPEKHAAYDVCKSITGAIGSYGNRSLAPDLLELLKQVTPQRDPFLLANIARTVGKLRARPIAKDLVHLLSNLQLDIELRSAIADTLGMLNEHSVVPDLLKLLQDHSLEINIKVSIANAIRELGTKEDIPALITLMNDQNLRDDQCGDVHRTVLVTLLRLARKDKGTSQELLEKLMPLKTSTHQGNLHGSIIIALSLLAEPKQHKQLPPLFKGRQESQDSLLSFLESVHAYELVFDLVPLLTDAEIDKNVRSSMASTIGALGRHCTNQLRQKIAQDLCQFLAGQQLPENVLLSIIGALKALKEKSIVKDLFSILNDTNNAPKIRNACVELIGVLIQDTDEAKKTIEELKRCESKETGAIRKSILITRGLLGDTEVVEELPPLLIEQGIDSEERERAAKALRVLDNKSVISYLRRYPFEYSLDPEVRLLVLRVLGDLADDEQTCSILARHLDSSDRNIKKNVYEALWNISRRSGLQIARDDHTKEITIKRWASISE
jgi:HEAT repeat protein